jgi:hypothetical protein
MLVQSWRPYIVHPPKGLPTDRQRPNDKYLANWPIFDFAGHIGTMLQIQPSVVLVDLQSGFFLFESIEKAQARSVVG